MTVASPHPSLQSLLSTLTTSLTSTATSLPSPPSQSITSSGISLLDLKNDVFLSYLHHLSFLLLFRIRNGTLSASSSGTAGVNGENGGDIDGIGEEVVKTLAGLRLWLEKGVKPCENKLKYQVEKVLKAASEWEREQARKLKEAESEDEESAADSNEEGSDDEEEDGDDDDDDDDEEITSESEVDEDETLPKSLHYDSDDLLPKHKQSTAITMKNALSYRPNPSLLAKPSSAALPSKDNAGDKTGIYRPPKLNPVSMPEPTPTTSNDPDARHGNTREKKQKARVIDDYVAMSSSAPIAEPSIGSNVGRLGRTKTTREREEERERREYEESNFVRLPGLTKKEKREKSRREGGRREWGGEDWGGIERGMGLDRIDKLTRKKGGNGGVLERSRKRGHEGDGGDVRIGERFEKRRKMVDKQRRRK
ncbi:hypothetical protein TWF694_004701 [Orbilia ellipsospora]|uniref:Uncharacterized protein n=1 Tax=Orbilia ellipsospora TaxID=2528407 RepID=A0AAV9WVV4_9PEZI